jgi:uncharacterized protein YyaL (SSP411 family)
MSAHENLLRHEASPYLLQHADNPVHWRPWGAAALAESVASDRPILLSVGYAACHWCHVMAHESFEDAETAALMNALYVCIKVDREERPDIDHLYMSALHALGEQGGWPLTMFLTPAGDPFWGGTYFPPEPRWGRPSFRQVLRGVADAFRTQHDAVRQNVVGLRDTLARMSAPRPGDPPGPALLRRTAASLLRSTDPDLGGLRGAPKFPNPAMFRFLWQEAQRSGTAGGAEAVHLLLRRMSQGGIYDHLGGGYARYSTDAEWLVPHFEKMLYDNAQLLELLALAHAAAPDPLYAERAAETAGWLERDMTAERVDGRAAFAASEDADSEGEEGRFYVWTAAEIDAALGPDADAFKAAYDVTQAGNWEGHSILRRVAGPLAEDEEAALARGRTKLFARRAGRVRPGRDDKVLADWNGLVIAALAGASAVFGRPDWLRRAEDAFAFVRAVMPGSDGRVQHAWRRGRVTAAGLLDDHASMARAALALFEATGDATYLDAATGWAEAAERWFAAPDGGWFITAADAADVPLGAAARPRVPSDNATPSGLGLMAEVFARLYHLTGAEVFRTRARTAIAAFGGLGDRLTACPTLLAAADLLDDATVAVIAGAPDLPATQALLAAALAAPDPATVVLRAPTADALPSGHPAHGKTVPPGRALAYVCRGGVCGLPIEEAAQLAAALRRGRPMT